MALTLLDIIITTAIALLGAGVGVIVGRLSQGRLLALVYLAMGVLLAVTLFDVLPDAKAALSWSKFLLAAASGFLLFSLVSRYIYPICPACSVASTMGGENTESGHSDGSVLDHSHGSLGAKGAAAPGRDVSNRAVAIVLVIAFSLHCMMDGMALVTADHVRRAIDYAVFAGVGLHKFPEGLALTLLLIGSGYSRGKAMLLASCAELMTILGGVLSLMALVKFLSFWPSVMLAHVGGGFLYLVWATVRPAIGISAISYRAHLLRSSLAFAATAAILWGSRGLGH